MEISCVVDGGLGAQGAAFFVVLLDARSFVVDMQGRNHSVGDHVRAKRSRFTSGDPTVEDQLHLFGASHVQIFTNYFFEEDSSADRSVEHLGEGEFDLQDGELIAVSGLSVPAGEGMR